MSLKYAGHLKKAKHSKEAQPRSQGLPSSPFPGAGQDQIDQTSGSPSPLGEGKKGDRVNEVEGSQTPLASKSFQASKVRKARRGSKFQATKDQSTHHKDLKRRPSSSMVHYMSPYTTYLPILRRLHRPVIFGVEYPTPT